MKLTPEERAARRAAWLSRLTLRDGHLPGEPSCSLAVNRFTLKTGPFDWTPASDLKAIGGGFPSRDERKANLRCAYQRFKARPR